MSSPETTGGALPAVDVEPTEQALGSGAPAWFDEALTHRPDEGVVRVAGADIAYLAWGSPQDPPVVLVHGGAAHSRWWTPIAPLLSDGHRVVALDLSGHGRSGRRPIYSVEQWADEVVAVAQVATRGRPTVIAHSMGGIITAHAAVRRGDELAAALLLDVPLWPNAPVPENQLLNRTSAPQRTYPTREQALSRFRLIPFQHCRCPWYLQHVALHSMRADGDGWTWSFDPKIFAPAEGRDSIARFGGRLEDSRCPVAIVLGERSYLVADCAAPTFVRRARGGPPEGVPVVHIPDAGHHLMLDQPLALVSALRGLLAAWDL